MANPSPASSSLAIAQHAFLPPRELCFFDFINRTSVKDGSITVGNPVEPGARLQLFVRDRWGGAAFCVPPLVIVSTTDSGKRMTHFLVSTSNLLDA